MQLRHHRLYRHFAVRGRLYVAAVFGVATWLVVPGSLIAQSVARVLIGWNAGAILYLALCAGTSRFLRH
jgi:fructose-1,6-bisphosphatase/inositol monophosphatase family enzyme